MFFEAALAPSNTPQLAHKSQKFEDPEAQHLENKNGGAGAGRPPAAAFPGELLLGRAWVCWGGHDWGRGPTRTPCPFFPRPLPPVPLFRTS